MALIQQLLITVNKIWLMKIPQKIILKRDELVNLMILKVKQNKKSNQIYKKTLRARFLIHFPNFPAFIFFPQGPEGKSMLELDSGVRFSSSPAWGQ